MDIPVILVNGKKVDVTVGDFTIRTDQPPEDGGEGTAPSPFDFFLASIASCAGYYVYDFCLRRDIPTDGISLVMKTEKNVESKRHEEMHLEIRLPASFPEKYEKAVIRAAALCSVKKHIEKAPAFNTYTTRSA